MTRRIGWAILLTVWATVITGGLVAYFTTRSVLLADLDASLIERAASLPEVASASGRPSGPLTAGDRYIVRNEVGKTVSHPSARPSGDHLLIPESASFAHLADGRWVRTLTLRIQTNSGGPGITVVYSGAADGFERLLNRLAFTLAVAGVISGVLAAVVAYSVTRTALRPLRQTADTLSDIDEHSLDRRIQEAALPPELRPVATRLNDLLTRVQEAFTRRKQFLADASHELRTPISAMLTTLEVALRRPRENDELTTALQTCLSEIRILSQLVKALLEQARSEAPQAGVALETLDLGLLLNECANTADALGAGRDIRVIRSFSPHLQVRADASRLRTVVMNLLGNAVEHNRPGGMVELSCEVNDGATALFVRDDGPGIAPEHLANLFQPFYRADAAHRADKDHLGLGLFLVHSHVKAMGGTCRVESCVGKGTTFVVKFPNASVGTIIPNP